jgi:hypothetical protein
MKYNVLYDLLVLWKGFLRAGQKLGEFVALTFAWSCIAPTRAKVKTNLSELYWRAVQESEQDYLSSAYSVQSESGAAGTIEVSFVIGGRS